MQNVLATMESKVSPEAIKASAPEGLKTGHINFGLDIYSTFAEDDTQNFKVDRIRAWADQMTQDQFGTACKDAQKIADNTDAACGFIAASGAKGAEKYGPKRKVINARMSEAKVLFGVQKMNPDVLKEKGYWAAVSAAREYLDQNNVKWDGDTKPTIEQRDAKKALRANDKAIAQAQETFPREAGESMKDWILRCADLAEQIQYSNELESVVQSLQKLGSVEMTLAACFEYIKAQGTQVMDEMGQRLHEEAESMIEDSLQDAPF